MSEVIEQVVDAVDEMEYQAELESTTKGLSKYKWIKNPREVAKRCVDVQFGRVPKSELIPVDWDKLHSMLD